MVKLCFMDDGIGTHEAGTSPKSHPASDPELLPDMTLDAGLRAGVEKTEEGPPRELDWGFQPRKVTAAGVKSTVAEELKSMSSSSSTRAVN